MLGADDATRTFHELLGRLPPNEELLTEEACLPHMSSMPPHMSC